MTNPTQDNWTISKSDYTQPLATFNTQWDITFSPTFDKLIHFHDEGKTLTTNVTELIGLLRERDANLELTNTHKALQGAS